MTDAERREANAYKRAWYARHKAGNTPVYQRLVARQLAYTRTHRPEKHLWWARQRQQNTRTYQHTLEHGRARSAGLTLAQYQARPRVQLVCCGVWQAVTTLPHVCAQCGRGFLQPEPTP